MGQKTCCNYFLCFFILSLRYSLYLGDLLAITELQTLWVWNPFAHIPLKAKLVLHFGAQFGPHKQYR